jgi:para-aminobenzoate synthetase/4-amino-4-deoxychorismate lyase
VDRELVSGSPEPLIVDLGGDLLETGSGNLFAVQAGRLVTPPADGRILPGVTRHAVLALAAEEGLDVSIEPIDPAGADELFVTSSVRGLRPVGHCEGIGQWPPGPVASALAERLRHDWAVPAPSKALR